MSYLIQSKNIYKFSKNSLLNIIQRVNCANVIVDNKKVSDINKGNRPNFSSGCPPEIAKKKFKEFENIFRKKI